MNKNIQYLIILAIVVLNYNCNQISEPETNINLLKSNDDYRVSEYLLPKFGETPYSFSGDEYLRIYISPDENIGAVTPFLLTVSKLRKGNKITLKIMHSWSSMRDSVLFYNTYTAFLDTFNIEKYAQLGKQIQLSDSVCKYCPNIFAGTTIAFEYYNKNLDLTYFKRSTVMKPLFVRLDPQYQKQILQTENLIHLFFKDMKIIFPDQKRIFDPLITPHFMD